MAGTAFAYVNSYSNNRQRNGDIMFQKIFLIAAVLVGSAQSFAFYSTEGQFQDRFRCTDGAVNVYFSTYSQDSARKQLVIVEDQIPLVLEQRDTNSIIGYVFPTYQDVALKVFVVNDQVVGTLERKGRNPLTMPCSVITQIQNSF